MFRTNLSWRNNLRMRWWQFSESANFQRTTTCLFPLIWVPRCRVLRLKATCYPVERDANWSNYESRRNRAFVGFFAGGLCRVRSRMLVTSFIRHAGRNDRQRAIHCNTILYKGDTKNGRLKNKTFTSVYIQSINRS